LRISQLQEESRQGEIAREGQDEGGLVKDSAGFGFTIAELHAAYAGGMPAREMVARVFAAIEAAKDPGIFITILDEDAVLSAAQALPPFDPAAFPLWGVPFAVKDNIDVAGTPTTCACPAFAYRPAQSAPVVERLLAAGAICIGKTNLDQFATGLAGVRTPYPIPRNAIDPRLVPGCSSSGSATAVARGIVSFALGTDTAGSGRVPAGLNNIVGLKPSCGAVSTRGVVPACHSLDCVSVFAGTVDDAWRILEIMSGYDPGDPFSRALGLGALSAPPSELHLGIPNAASLEFFGDSAAADAFARARDVLERLGASLREIDLQPFFEAASLLYDGPWIAERRAALKSFMADHADGMLPVTRSILESADQFSAADAFGAIYKLAALRRATEPVWNKIVALAVPTAPCAPELASLAADPIGPNSRLGTYTNFVNLLDLAALAVPGPWRPDGRPAGLTFIGPSGSDGRLASLGRVFHASCDLTIGATGRRLAAS
jgi:allophanate hydrolase